MRKSPSTWTGSIRRTGCCIHCGELGPRESRAKAPFDFAQGRSAPHDPSSASRGTKPSTKLLRDSRASQPNLAVNRSFLIRTAGRLASSATPPWTDVFFIALGRRSWPATFVLRQALRASGQSMARTWVPNLSSSGTRSTSLRGRRIFTATTCIYGHSLRKRAAMAQSWSL